MSSKAGPNVVRDYGSSGLRKTGTFEYSGFAERRVSLNMNSPFGRDRPKKSEKSPHAQHIIDTVGRIAKRDVTLSIANSRMTPPGEAGVHCLHPAGSI
jgi:hypothetical protein